MTRKYTAADFANARFAKHPDGRVACRLSTKQEQPWRAEAFTDMEIPFGVFYVTDRGLAQGGWVPVPTKPTITESVAKAETANMNAGDKAIFGLALYVAGVEVIPDPEPTDEELLAGIIRNIDDWQSITSPELLAKYLNTAGVTPPNVKGN